MVLYIYILYKYHENNDDETFVITTLTTNPGLIYVFINIYI